MRNSNILLTETPSYSHQYNYPENELNGDNDGSDTLCFKGSGDMENTRNDDNFYLEDHQHLGENNYLDINILNDSVEQYYNSTPPLESRRLRKKTTPKTTSPKHLQKQEIKKVLPTYIEDNFSTYVQLKANVYRAKEKK